MIVSPQLQAPEALKCCRILKMEIPLEITE